MEMSIPPPLRRSVSTTTSPPLLGISPEATVKTNHVTNRLMFNAEYYVAVQYDNDNADNDDDDVSILTMESKEEEHSNDDDDDDDDDDDNCSLGGHLNPSSHHACHHNHYYHHHHHVTNISLHEIRKHDKIDCHSSSRFSSSDDRLHDSKNTLSTFCSSNATASNKSMSAPIKPQRTRSPSPQPSLPRHAVSDSLRKSAKHSSSPWGTCSEHPMNQPKSTSLQTRSSHLPPNKPLRYQSRIYENHFWESDDDDDDDESGTSFHDDYIDPFLKPVTKESEIVINKVRSQPSSTERPNNHPIAFHWDMHEAFDKVGSDRSIMDDSIKQQAAVPPKQPQRRITSCDF